ncbi:MAG: cell filamentation protein Fic [Clostridiales bacterium]|nr:cell filamentation protein Fic [Clostridiales bacterium]
MGYDIDPISENCYPNTTVLINKLDIRDEETLNEAETLATFINASKLEQLPLEGAFDFAHYKAVHYFLFSDLYDWAGQIRTVNISKKGTGFCPADEIEERAALIFSRLKEKDFFQKLPHDAFVDEIVDFYCATNNLHPFREGNGRTQRAFLTQLIRNAGYDISFGDMDVDLLMIATIQSANGVTDLLRRVLDDAMSSVMETNEQHH